MRRQLCCGPGTSGTNFSSAWNSGWSEPVEMYPNCPLPPVQRFECYCQPGNYESGEKLLAGAKDSTHGIPPHERFANRSTASCGEREEGVPEQALTQATACHDNLEPLSLRVWALIMRFSTARAGHRTALRVVWYRPYRVVLFSFIVAVGVTRLTTRLPPRTIEEQGRVVRRSMQDCQSPIFRCELGLEMRWPVRNASSSIFYPAWNV